MTAPTFNSMLSCEFCKEEITNYDVKRYYTIQRNKMFPLSGGLIIEQFCSYPCLVKQEEEDMRNL